MKKLMFTLFLMLGSLIVLQAGDNWYAIGETISFESKILNEERSIIVYTPETYNLGDQSYPVMYLLDGGAHFHHVSGIAQFLAGNGLIPEMIVVAVKNVDRTRDFSPTHNDKWPTTGGAEKFLSFVGKELVPFVERNFRTEPYKILVGHSFGGEFAAYALLEKPDLFNAYIAISPYLMYDDNYIVKEAKAKLKSSYKNEIQFFMTVGNEPDYFATLDDFINIVESKSPQNFDLTYVRMEDENHGSIPHLSVYQGLESIYSGWKMPKDVFAAGLDGIDTHYQDLSKKYGYEIATPEYTINALGYFYMNNEKVSKAIDVFKINTARFPNSANVYDSLGEAYENESDYEKAMKNYSIAVEHAQKVDHPNLKIYKKNLERVQKEIAQN